MVSNMKSNMLKEIKDKIRRETEWMSLSEIPSAASYVKLNDKCLAYWNWHAGSFGDIRKEYYGIYQVSLTRPKPLIHKDITYIGQSTCLPKRVSDLRAAAVATNKVAHHMCGIYIREEKIDIKRVYVRCILPYEESDVMNIERWLHDEHKSRFNYKTGYAWEEASGGHRSSRIQCQHAIKRLETIKDCEKVMSALSERMKILKSNGVKV